MNRSEKAFAIATGIAAFTITVIPWTYEFLLPILAIAAMALFVLSHKSSFRQWPNGSLSIWPGSEDPPKSSPKQRRTRWAAIGVALWVGVTGGYLVQVLFE
jgi:hypothetical protein